MARGGATRRAAPTTSIAPCYYWVEQLAVAARLHTVSRPLASLGLAASLSLPGPPPSAGRGEEKETAGFCLVKNEAGGKGTDRLVMEEGICDSAKRGIF
jgi:hypothetical protein